MTHRNLLGDPPPTLLTEDEAAAADRAAGAEPVSLAGRYPAYPAAWADLADAAFAAGRTVDSYAYARVGYHRGLDQLRRAGWHGAGRVPWSHGPNRGFLRCLHALSRAAAAIGEDDEAERCRQLLLDSDPTAAAALQS